MARQLAPVEVKSAVQQSLVPVGIRRERQLEWDPMGEWVPLVVSKVQLVVKRFEVQLLGRVDRLPLDGQQLGQVEPQLAVES
jgi:hypothetical protein